jgi:hypothetical protein
MVIMGWELQFSDNSVDELSYFAEETTIPKVIMTKLTSIPPPPSFIGQLAIGQRTAYISQLSHACCQKRWTKSADLPRTQAGRPLVVLA